MYFFLGNFLVIYHYALMKEFLLLYLSLAATFHVTPDGSVKRIDEQQIAADTIFEKGQIYEFKLDRPLIVNGENDRLCFSIASYTDSIFSKSPNIEEFVQRAFGHEEYSNIWTYTPRFMAGKVTTSTGMTYDLEGLRYLSLKRISKMSFDYDLSVCTIVEGHPRNIQHLLLQPLVNFKAYRVYWFDSLSR